MSFFGFETNGLEADKRQFLEGSLQESEDLAVYNWGEDNYDGLGDALVEGGDELNDETFGGMGEVGESWTPSRSDLFEPFVLHRLTGKDFDFTQHTLPDPVGIKQEQRRVVHEPPREQTPLQEYIQATSRSVAHGEYPLSCPVSV